MCEKCLRGKLDHNIADNADPVLCITAIDKTGDNVKMLSILDSGPDNAGIHPRSRRPGQRMVGEGLIQSRCRNIEMDTASGRQRVYAFERRMGVQCTRYGASQEQPTKKRRTKATSMVCPSGPMLSAQLRATLC